MGTARDRVLQAASELFYRNGITATGIDTIIERAGVAKMTLYNHFSSKNELVAAYLRERDEQWWRRLARVLAQADDPQERLLSPFAAYRACTLDEDFRGCAFVNGAAEVPVVDHPAAEVIRAHKLALRDRLRQLAAEAEAAAPAQLAEQLFLLLEGAMVTAGIIGSAAPFDHAEAAARTLVRQDAQNVAAADLVS